MESLACCYFPSTTVLVDDQTSFLSKLEVNLQQVTPVKSFNDAHSALKFISSATSQTLDLSHLISNQVQYESSLSKPDQPALIIDVPQILQQLYNPQRFLQVSDMLVDYNMPVMNGLDLCEQVNNKYIRRLMITGEVDMSIAISAFNKGIISKFITKQTEKFTQTLIDAVISEKQQYFANCSATIINNLASDSYNCLQHPKFSELFAKLCEEYQIVEYYMIDDNGSFLMLDKAGKPTWFVVRSQQALEDNTVFAEDTRAPKGILDVLQNREKMVFLFSEQDQHLPAIKWLPYLQPTKAMPGVEGFYYTIVRDEAVYDEQLDEFISFERFMLDQEKAA